MDGQNYVVFHADSNNSYMNSTANFKGADVGTTFIDLFFASSAGVTTNSSTGYDKVRLTVTAAYEEVALEAVAGAMAGNMNPVTVIASDVSGKTSYIHDRITAVASITLATQANTRHVEAITNASAVTRTLTTAESGSLFTVDMSTVDNNVAITLPTAATAMAGTYYDFCFIVDSDDDADFSVTTGANGTDIYGYLVTGGANSTLDDVDGLSKFTLDASVATTVEGCRVHLLCDGVNWHLSGYLKTAIGTVHLVESASA